MKTNKKTAIVYDWIDKWGGVERVLLELHDLFPEADFYTSYYDKRTAEWAKNLKIHTSFLQNFPDFIKKNRVLSMIFYPFVFESMNFSEYEMVISVTSSFAKSIITQSETKHICYLLTPTRYFWSHEEQYFNNKFIRRFLKKYLDGLKNWDFVAAQRPDKIISISETVKNRTKKYYQRNSDIVYPGFDLDYWKKIKDKLPNLEMIDEKFKILDKQKYYLVVSRLEKYKRIDLAIDVFNKRGDLLIIVGEGAEEANFKQKAKKNIIFLSKLSDLELGSVYTNAQALIMPQEEDFGYVSLEAQFFNCPVIAYGKGGATETVIDGKTGLFFAEQKEKALRTTIERYDKIKNTIRRNIPKYGPENLRRFDMKIFSKKFINQCDF